jgi:hypothetical protein
VVCVVIAISIETMKRACYGQVLYINLFEDIFKIR